jgi:hypothetical protein
MTPPFTVTAARTIDEVSHHYTREWHSNADSALAAFLDHQQRDWDWVRMTPMAEYRFAIPHIVCHLPVPQELRL